jgi:hypothetical protein
MEPSQPLSEFESRTFQNWLRMPFYRKTTLLKGLIHLRFKFQKFWSFGVFLLLCHAAQSSEQQQRLRLWNQYSALTTATTTATATATSAQVSKTVLYPKCTDDSDCTGEQICHFSQTGFHSTERHLVIIYSLKNVKQKLSLFLYLV